MSDSHKSPFRLDADLPSLRTLVAVADEGGFSAAARRVGRTQSAVSLQIAKLEDRVQARLFDRTSRSVAPTAAGETLIAYARRILDLADEAMLALTTPPASEPLRVGFAEYLAPGSLHALLDRFRRAHPQAGLHLRLGSGARLAAELAAGDLDVVVAGPEAEGGEVLLREPLVWVAAADRPVEAERPVPLVLMQPPCSYRQAAFDALAAADRAWRVTMEANALQGVQSAVAAGLGVSVVPRSAVTPGLRILARPFPLPPETAVVGYRRARSAHPLADRLLAFLAETLAAGMPAAGPSGLPGAPLSAATPQPPDAAGPAIPAVR